MFCEGESVNNIFRYNISVNDGTGTITPVRNVDAHIYNNTFIIPESVPFIRQGMSEGGMLVENNIIINAGKTAKNEDWHHQTEKAVYHNNLYCNYRNIPEEDDKAIIADNADEVLENPNAVYEGFRLAENSPAAGKGKRIKGDDGVDFFGKHTDSPPDIGACFAHTKKQN